MVSKHLFAVLAVWTVILKVAGAQHFGISGVHTGINNKTGARPLRRDINDLHKDIPTWYEKPDDTELENC